MRCSRRGSIGVGEKYAPPATIVSGMEKSVCRDTFLRISNYLHSLTLSSEPIARKHTPNSSGTAAKVRMDEASQYSTTLRESASICCHRPMGGQIGRTSWCPTSCFQPLSAVGQKSRFASRWCGVALAGVTRHGGGKRLWSANTTMIALPRRHGPVRTATKSDPYLMLVGHSWYDRYMGGPRAGGSMWTALLCRSHLVYA